MKTKLIISTLIILIAVIFSCKKQPEIPSSSKITFQQNIIDSTGYNGGKISSVIIGLNKNIMVQYGHCWSNVGDPTINNSKTNLGTESNSDTATSTLTGLTNNSKYFVRPYVTLSSTTLYGNVIQINTLKPSSPIVITKEVINITVNSASCKSENDNGGLTISARGVCWSTNDGPTLSNNIGYTNEEVGIGNFTSELIDLVDNTTYFVTGYATNEEGTNYGEPIQFKTLELSLPSVTTVPPTNITASSAISGGEVTNDGNSTVIARGICWSTSISPTLNDSFTVDGSGMGTFVSGITGLSGNTQYYIRAYATNAKGSVYGDEEAFITTGCSIPEISTANGTVFSPADGTTISPGNSIEITWEYEGSGQVHIYLYKNNDFVQVIMNWSVNVGSYYYSLPTSLSQSDCYQIVIGYEAYANPPGNLPNNNWGSGYIVGSYFTIE